MKRANVPWAREGSGFTLLFEQAAMILVREMPVLGVRPINPLCRRRGNLADSVRYRKWTLWRHHGRSEASVLVG